jgi:hypothetical protein
MNKAPTQSEVNKFIELTSTASYNYDKKETFRKLGRKILKYIAQELDLKKGEYEISFNPGGIACSGDHTLRTKHLCLALYDNLGRGWFYYRSTKGLKDYTGGANQIVRWATLERRGLEPLIKALRVMEDGGWYQEDGDFVRTQSMVERTAMSYLK